MQGVNDTQRPKPEGPRPKQKSASPPTHLELLEPRTEALTPGGDLGQEAVLLNRPAVWNNSVKGVKDGQLVVCTADI